MDIKKQTDTISGSELDTLIERAASGDSAAFGQIYDLYADRIYNHIYYRTGNSEDARDLTQEVFLKAWRGLPSYKRTPTPFLGWLFTISHNRVVDHYRTRKEQVYLNNEISPAGSETSPEKLVEAEFTQSEIKKAIEKLPGDQQQVILMSFIEGLEYPEIAASLQKSEGNIRVILHRGLKKLRQILRPGE